MAAKIGEVKCRGRRCVLKASPDEYLCVYHPADLRFANWTGPRPAQFLILSDLAEWPRGRDRPRSRVAEIPKKREEIRAKPDRKAPFARMNITHREGVVIHDFRLARVLRPFVKSSRPPSSMHRNFRISGDSSPARARLPAAVSSPRAAAEASNPITRRCIVSREGVQTRVAIAS